MSGEFGYNPEIQSKNETKKIVNTFLELPERICSGNQEKDIPRQLGIFLVDREYIKGVDCWKNSWGFKYDSRNRNISISEKEMSEESYNYYVFRLGKDANGEPLYPQKGTETDAYRFLHETSHAYQDFLIDKDGASNWHDKAIKGEVDSIFSLLFGYCYQKRINNPGKGLSTWGNVPDYNSIENKNNQNVIRAVEDANELVTMCLWNQKYFETFLDYLSLSIPGYDVSSLEADKLAIISNDEKEALNVAVQLYIKEMKKNIAESY